MIKPITFDGTQGTTSFTQIASLNQNAAVQVSCLKK